VAAPALLFGSEATVLKKRGAINEKPLYRVSTQGTRISLIDKFPTSSVFRRVLIMLESKFNSLHSRLTSLINKKEHFKLP
jgi:hypothetical protein